MRTPSTLLDRGVWKKERKLKAWYLNYSFPVGTGRNYIWKTFLKRQKQPLRQNHEISVRFFQEGQFSGNLGETFLWSNTYKKSRRPSCVLEHIQKIQEPPLWYRTGIKNLGRLKISTKDLFCQSTKNPGDKISLSNRYKKSRRQDFLIEQI